METHKISKVNIAKGLLTKLLNIKLLNTPDNIDPPKLILPAPFHHTQTNLNN